MTRHEWRLVYNQVLTNRTLLTYRCDRCGSGFSHTATRGVSSLINPDLAPEIEQEGIGDCDVEIVEGVHEQ